MKTAFGARRAVVFSARCQFLLWIWVDGFGIICLMMTGNAMCIRKTFDLRNDVTLFHGDCMRLLRKTSTASVQRVITSPPYNVGKEYERNLTIESYLKFQRRVIAECVRIVQPGGSICWQVGNHVNGHGQMVPLDLLLHPLFAAFADSDKLRIRN